jgi:hypothetical protein
MTCDVEHFFIFLFSIYKHKAFCPYSE